MNDKHRGILSSMSTLFSPLSIAPMIDWTYTHFRVFMRMLAPHALLYTEMQTPGAVKNNPKRALTFHPQEEPLALQLGGADCDALVYAAQQAEQLGFSEINLNLGCPSDKVLSGRFGACLMQEPDKVADCIGAMKRAVSIPVTAKTRIGIDHQDSYDFFSNFVHRLVEAGCDKIIVHARKAWLSGLSPKQNRTIPPLHYEYVYQIKHELKKTNNVPIVINGNIHSAEAVVTHLNQVDGVMLGRLACQNPYALTGIHNALYPKMDSLSRFEVLQNYIDYVESQWTPQLPVSIFLKPIFNMAHSLPFASLWKTALMDVQRQADCAKLREAIFLFN